MANKATRDVDPVAKVELQQSCSVSAAWTAWVLEEAGYSVWFQDWDFNDNFVLEIDRAHAPSRGLVLHVERYEGQKAGPSSSLLGIPRPEVRPTAADPRTAPRPA